jgi:exosortase
MEGVSNSLSRLSYYAHGLPVFPKIMTPPANNSRTGAAATPPLTPSQRLLGLLTPEGMLILGLLLAAFVGLFFRWFRIQHLISSSKMEDWGHAYIIPLLSAFLIWKHRADIARIRPTIFWPGLAPFVLGIISYFWGVVGIKNHMFQGFAIILAILGLSLLLLGPRMFRYVFLPIAFLIFAVTVSERIMIDLTFPLQLAASQGGYFVLSVVGFFAGFTVDVHGNLIDIIDSTGKAHPLNIAAACSGMRMVVAFFALAGATAILGCKVWWQRVALMLLAAPVAIVINTGRVSVLGLLSLWDPELASGEAHTAIGTFLLIPGLLLFMAVIWALNKIIKPDVNAGAIA